MQKKAKLRICFLILVCLSFPAGVLAGLGQVINWQSGKARIVFSSGNGGVWYPRLLKLANGDLLCSYDTNHNGSFTKVHVAKSIDNGESWSPLSIASFGSANTGNAQLTQLPNGDILCAYRLVNNGRKTLEVSKSSDNGKTWRTRSRPFSGKLGYHHFNSLLQLDDGTIIAATGRWREKENAILITKGKIVKASIF